MFVNHPAHFGDHFVIKLVAKSRHKHKARFRQQIAVALFAPLRVEKQRAQLAAAGVIVTEKQRRQCVIDIQLFRSVNQRADTIVVPGIVQPNRHLNGANPRHSACLTIFQYKHITLLTFGQFALPGFDCPFNTHRKRGFIGGKRRQAAARFAGKLHQLRDI